MRKFIVAIAAVFLGVLVGCGFGTVNKPLIVTSIPVWKSVAEYLGGKDFDYYSILKGGESPHGYEIKPSDIVKLKEAKLIIIQDLGLDDWVLKGVENKTKVMNLGELFKEKYPFIKKPGYHMWTNPVLMEDVYFEVAKRLAKFNPHKELYYTKRAEDYASMIEQLLRRSEKCIESAKSKKVIAYHPVWEPLFETIGVKCVGYIVQNPEEEPEPARVKALIEKAKKENVKLIVVSKGVPEKFVDNIAKEIGAKVLVLDPLPEKDYVAALSEWLSKICNALKEVYGK